MRLAPFEQAARMVIGRRIGLGITQEQLAERMETSASTISRIESGRHVTSGRPSSGWRQRSRSNWWSVSRPRRAIANSSASSARRNAFCGPG